MIEGQLTTDRESWLYPRVWENCVGAWTPCLGPTNLSLIDRSGYGATGTIYGATANNAWVLKNGIWCVTLTGTFNTPLSSYNYVKVPSSAIFGQASPVYSVVCWFATTATIGALTAFNGTNVTKYQFNIGNCPYITGSYTNGKLSCGQYASGGTHTASTNSLATCNDGNWHCAIQTVSTSKMSLYLDGAFQSSVTTQGGTVAENDSLFFGCNGAINTPFSTPQYLAGQIAEVRVYSRLLYNDEIVLLSKSPGAAYTSQNTINYAMSLQKCYASIW